jgi:hypothetical protein
MDAEIRHQHLKKIESHLNDNDCSRDQRIVDESPSKKSDWHVYNISFLSSREEKDEFERTLRKIDTQLYAIFEFRPGITQDGYYVYGSTRDSRRFAEEKFTDVKSRIEKLDQQGHL